MPSYHLFNHKAGSVSSIYSTFGFDIDINVVIRYSNISSSRTGRRSRSAPRRFILTEDEGDTEPPSQFPKKRTALGRETFRPPHYHGTRFPGTFGGTPDFREARGTHQKSTRGLNLCFCEGLVLFCIVLCRVYFICVN